MRNSTKLFNFNVLLILLVLLMAGCNGKGATNEDSEQKDTNNDRQLQDEVTDAEEETDDTEKDINNGKTEDEQKQSQSSTNGTNNTNESNETDNSSSEKTEKGETNNASKNESNSALSGYSPQEIEYARVWLQLGEVKDVEELNVRHIPSGTPLNPDDKTSVNYPNDVIQLTGSRLVDGVVTYSSNGNGTINVYNVPLRWDGKNPAGEDFYKNIINNTKLVSVDVGNDEEVKKLIKKIED